MKSVHDFTDDQVRYLYDQVKYPWLAKKLFGRTGGLGTAEGRNTTRQAFAATIRDLGREYNRPLPGK